MDARRSKRARASRSRPPNESAAMAPRCFFSSMALSIRETVSSYIDSLAPTGDLDEDGLWGSNEDDPSVPTDEHARTLSDQI